VRQGARVERKSRFPACPPRRASGRQARRVAPRNDNQKRNADSLPAAGRLGGQEQFRLGMTTIAKVAELLRRHRAAVLAQGTPFAEAPSQNTSRQTGVRVRQGARAEEKADSLPARHGGQAAGRLVAWLLGMTTKKEMQIPCLRRAGLGGQNSFASITATVAARPPTGRFPR